MFDGYKSTTQSDIKLMCLGLYELIYSEVMEEVAQDSLMMT